MGHQRLPELSSGTIRPSGPIHSLLVARASRICLILHGEGSRGIRNQPYKWENPSDCKDAVKQATIRRNLNRPYDHCCRKNTLTATRQQPRSPYIWSCQYKNPNNRQESRREVSLKTCLISGRNPLSVSLSSLKMAPQYRSLPGFSEIKKQHEESH